ncbi:MAG: spermidine/putrescine ABC transporter substrate-binding protein [Desulfobacterales bacterium]|nr:spermidine/putrescine ABC transporter substrate-binding protein [Desulfobacterales bacterium]
MKNFLGSSISRRKFLKGAAAFSVGVTFAPGMVWGAEEKKLNVYNWDTYIGEDTIYNFSKEFGMKVQYDLYANNEELFSKLKEGNPGFDLIFPSDYLVETMIKLDKLVPLDHSKIPNKKHIDPDPNFSDPTFDPGLKYHMPYMWGTMGIGYRKSKFKTPPDSWKVLLDSDEYSGKISLLADQRSTIGITLKYLGYSMNSVNPKEIAEARDLLIKQKKHIKSFAEDNGQDLLLSGECDAVMEWSGDIVQVMNEDDDLAYIVPKEGSNVWQDTMCIPTGAPHPGNSHTFINYILDPKVNAEITKFIQFATPNKSAKQYLPKEDLENPAIYAPPEVIAKSETTMDVGDDARLYDEAWIAIQAS